MNKTITNENLNSTGTMESTTQKDMGKNGKILKARLLSHFIMYSRIRLYELEIILKKSFTIKHSKILWIIKGRQKQTQNKENIFTSISGQII